ncbi:MAG: lytic transglycosylase [Gammaproteobacteria bacterium]|nr:MAG: lytic transglycosylase [Gammaproteobacteria bacterium]
MTSNVKPNSLWLIVALIGVFASPASFADIWKYVDPQGVVHLTDRPRGPGYRLLLRSKRKTTSWTLGDAVRSRNKLSRLIQNTAKRHGVDSALVHAVITAESRYNPDAVSRAGAEGLMQLMPGTAQRYGVRDARNPAENVNAGVRYLRDLLRQFRRINLALAAYNAGENAVLRYGRRIPPFPETQTYVRRVLSYYRAYRRRS